MCLMLELEARKSGLENSAIIGKGPKNTQRRRRYSSIRSVFHPTLDRFVVVEKLPLREFKDVRDLYPSHKLDTGYESMFRHGMLYPDDVFITTRYLNGETKEGDWT